MLVSWCSDAISKSSHKPRCHCWTMLQFAPSLADLFTVGCLKIVQVDCWRVAQSTDVILLLSCLELSGLWMATVAANNFIHELSLELLSLDEDDVLEDEDEEELSWAT